MGITDLDEPFTHRRCKASHGPRSNAPFALNSSARRCRAKIVPLGFPGSKQQGYGPVASPRYVRGEP